MGKSEIKAVNKACKGVEDILKVLVDAEDNMAEASNMVEEKIKEYTEMKERLKKTNKFVTAIAKLADES